MVNSKPDATALKRNLIHFESLSMTELIWALNFPIFQISTINKSTHRTHVGQLFQFLKEKLPHNGCQTKRNSLHIYKKVRGSLTVILFHISLILVQKDPFG